MNYHPKYKTCEELLVANGFVPATKGMGWERIKPEYMEGNRLHASTYHGYISVHYDVLGGPNGHQGKSYHKQVRRCMREFEALDKPWWHYSNLATLLYGEK